MDVLRNRFDDNDLVNAPSLLERPANPGPEGDPESPPIAAVPAVVCALPQLRRRVDDDPPPMMPVRLLCLFERCIVEVTAGGGERRKKNNISREPLTS